MNTLTYVVLTVCVTVAVTEDCNTLSDCTNTQCTAGSPTCVDISGTHLCTCIQQNTHGITCSSKNDCEMLTNSAFANSCVAAQRHCVDGHCHCEGQGHQHPGPGDHNTGNHHQPGQHGAHQPAAGQ